MLNLQTHFHSCAAEFPSIGCSMFTNEMAKRATTMSLSILVVIEMFNVRLTIHFMTSAKSD